MPVVRVSEHHVHHVGYSASPHPNSMQHHNELQMVVCESIVLGYVLSMRVIETTVGQVVRDM